MSKVKVKFVGEESYSGFDGDEIVNLSAGESTHVSEDKAAQLAADRPHDFEIDGKPAGKPATAKKLTKKQQAEADAAAAAAAAEAREQLLEQSREELDAAALEAGIDDPEAIDDVEQLVDAIIAKRAENDAA